MFSTDAERFDKQTRRELDVSDSAWLRQVNTTTIEARLGENLEPIAVAVNEGAGGWCIRTPDGITFTGDPLSARRLLWEAAAATPTRPALSRSAPPRVGWDFYRAG
jgi:hypothetical protein